MIKFYYILIDAFLRLKRNRSVTFTNFSIFFVFSFLLNIFGRLYLIFTKMTVESQKNQDVFDQVGALQQLIHFSAILQVLSWLAITTTGILGIFYYKSIFTKHFLTQKEEFLTMKLVGSSSTYISLTVLWETLYALAMAYLVETALIRFCYMWVVDRSSDLLQVSMIQPIYFKAAIELPVLAGMLALVILLTISLQRKIYPY
ncbi:hypothetical protein [Enterococcus sp. AZ109]|uniref:hypothetical protein n=1 Tax=Enterococcus sp. AZ109 TaxID=2774634 RepID=UPI003F29686D